MAPGGNLDKFIPESSAFKISSRKFNPARFTHSRLVLSSFCHFGVSKDFSILSAETYKSLQLFRYSTRSMELVCQKKHPEYFSLIKIVLHAQLSDWHHTSTSQMKVDLTSSPVVHGELFFHSVFQHFKKDLFIFKEELEPGSYRFSFWVEREEGRLTFFNSCLVLAHKRASHQILKFKGEFLLLSFFEDQRWRLDQCFPCSEAHEAKRLDEGEMTLAASSLIHDSGNRESFNLGTFVRSNYKQWFSYASFLRDKKRTLNVLQLKNQFGQWKLELWPYPTLELPESICGDRPIFKSTLADTSNTYTLFHLKDQSQLALMTCRLNSLREFFQEPQ